MQCKFMKVVCCDMNLLSQWASFYLSGPAVTIVLWQYEARDVAALISQLFSLPLPTWPVRL